MHSDGVLSEEEFKALKAKLISRISNPQNSADSQPKQKTNEQTSGAKTEITDFRQVWSALTQLRGWSKKNSKIAWSGGALIVCVLGYMLFFSSGGTPVEKKPLWIVYLSSGQIVGTLGPYSDMDMAQCKKRIQSEQEALSIIVQAKKQFETGAVQYKCVASDIPPS
jgi:hypothetical protein